MEDQPEREDLKEAGIEQGSRLEKITYNRSAQAVAAHFRRGREGSVYYRHRASSRYHKIAKLGERVSYEDPVTASSAPVLFVNVREFSADSSGVMWHSVARIDMRTGEIMPVFCEDDLKLQQPYYRGWVRELHEAWADGRGVVCTMSFLRPATRAEEETWRTERGGELAGAGEHWICDLNLEQKTYERLTLLKAMHF